MGKTKSNGKVGFFDFNNMRIQERLKKSYIMVLAFATVAAVVGVIAVFVVSTNYKSAMDNYALPQGDIGKLMQCVADCRSATRGIIGYDSEAQVDALIESHDSYVEEVNAYIAKIKPTMVTPEGHAAMAEIESTIATYFEIEQNVIELSKIGNAAAQTKAINEMAPAYTAAYNALDYLMQVNIQKANEMNVALNILQLGALIFILIVIVIAAKITQKHILDIYIFVMKHLEKDFFPIIT